MEFVTCGDSNGTDTDLCVKEEPLSEFLGNFDIDSVPSIMAANSSLQGMKNENESEEEITSKPSRKRRKVIKPKAKKTLKNGSSEFTQLPCIVNIKSSVVHENINKSHNGTFEDETPSTSLQFSNSEKTWESDDYVTFNETVEQSISNSALASKIDEIYEICTKMLCTVQGLKEATLKNTQEIEKLQMLLPQPWSWRCEKFDFEFPIETDEQLSEIEKQLENKETSSRLFAHLTTRAYSSWREMVLICIKYLLSRKVAILYNLNGRKGKKKKFRDLNICNILVECVQYKFKEAPLSEILKRISLILAGAGDWQGSRYKK